MMKASTTATRVAIPVHNGRISPVFEVARRLLIAEVGDGGIRSREEVNVDDIYPPRRAEKLKSLDVDVLLCGAISRHMAVMLSSSKVEVTPFLSGSVDEVLNAFVSGSLDRGRFAMPGCRIRRRRMGGGQRRGRCGREVCE
jgi:predicted Fe-Mo cluster-binding NifX family protein